MRNTAFYALLAVSLVAVAFTSGCIYGGGGTSNTGTTVPSGNSIQIINFTFIPSTVAVPLGTSVTWVNSDSVPHTVTPDIADNPSGFGSGQLSNGQTYTFTFTQPGTYKYHCSIHPGMTATIIVQ